jgi:hypothetical protein
LLNLEAQPHHTVVLSDFPLPQADVIRLRRHLSKAPTRLLFGRIDRGVPAVQRALKNNGVDVRRHYVSLQGVVSRYENVSRLHDLLADLTRGDVARLDLPFAQAGFRPAHASHLLRVVSRADYAEQDAIANSFFALLERRRLYDLTAHTPGGATLRITDDTGWFPLAGRLRSGEFRTLPAGEVSYPGSQIDGAFVADGALLASPEHPGAAREAVRLGRMSRELREHPLRIEISRGRVTNVSGRGRLSSAISRLIDRDPRYGIVTEVGISFNRACRKFIHRWGAASNEGRPGVHIAIGGDPDHRDGEGLIGEPLVHLDLMAANCSVFVNGRPFLRASSADATAATLR